MVSKEVIEQFGRKLAEYDKLIWNFRPVSYVDEISVSDLTREDIKAIGEWLGETVYLDNDGFQLILHPNQDEIEVGLWTAI